jgi:predicted metal-dependent HD superfamily phosphohydrolase
MSASTLFNSSPLFTSDEQWLTTIRNHYSESNRYYHTVSHINHLLELYNQHSSKLHDLKSVELAIYFHE